eukprot:CAMPEP_0196139572 /NCGR_PEP_ID=MMETSP0910-20130528/6800_1 /TAXON_ID=49265 /ORGANISM="Thalassiosira rotula, Strain GSO102" /LENGTH=209 /DNA_ID=CAMNT_0041400313 /DNA_START=94 /DNA_END=723 /DNA_ORIENTATION=+
MNAVASRWMSLLLLVACAASAATSSGSFGGFRRITTSHPTKSIHQIRQFRGGAIADSDDEYDSEEYDSESEEEDEPIVTTAKKLAASTKTVAQKKKTAAVKSKVKVAMAASSASKSVAKKTGGPNLYKRYVPYIIRACLNPFTLIAMTRAYFVSLCDINYPKVDQSQTLRSALEEKARKQPTASGPSKPTRKMKPGQAKTISDLPQLSA